MKRHLDRVSIARLRRAHAQGEHGYVAVAVGIMLMVLLSFCAFAVDVGNWYFTAQRAQRAADAGALAGVTYLPGNQTSAFSTARDFATKNNFTANATTTVTPAIDGRPTRLRVTVTKTVKNQFGWLMGRDTTTVARTAVADYAGPVPMGSPCNEFGNDPDATSAVRGTTCAGVSGQMWANVNSPSADKGNGDSFQSKNGCGSGIDGCTGSTNNDYTADGYFYTISVKQSMPTLTVQIFDPTFVDTGLTCGSNSSDPDVWGSGSSEAVDSVNPYVTAADAATRYAPGASSAYCTGDNQYSGSQVMNTKFTLRSPSASAWDPLSFTPVCTKTYIGYRGDLFPALDQYTSGTTPRSTYKPDVAEGFRRWSTLCTIPNPQVGDYLLQVQSNVGTPYDSANSGNRFSIRATASNVNAVSISGREKMGIYSNKPGAVTEFYLARVPTGAAGQTLNVKLFDVGDSNTSGTIKIVPPSGGSYSNCVATGPTSGNLSNCSFTVQSSTHNGKWQQVSVPIPSTYSCTDTDPTACWVKLTYTYGGSSKPTDVTTWTATIEGDPVRLVE